VQRTQLLRSLAQRGEEGRELAAGRLHPGGGPHLGRLEMGMADDQARLPSVTGHAGGGIQQQRAAGDRLAMLASIGQAHKQAPPVVGERGDAGDEAAAPATK